MYCLSFKAQVEERFNRHHAKARNIIERTFGILKTRWRSIFLRALEIRPLFAPKVVGACCILHNICVATDYVCQEEGDEEEAAQAGPDAETECTGVDRELVSEPGLLHDCLLLNSCLHICLNMTTSR